MTTQVYSMAQTRETSMQRTNRELGLIVRRVISRRRSRMRATEYWNDSRSFLQSAADTPFMLNENRLSTVSCRLDNDRFAKLPLLRLLATRFVGSLLSANIAVLVLPRDIAGFGVDAERWLLSLVFLVP